MRFIIPPKCECCGINSATQQVFTMLICQDCRMGVIHWMRDRGFSLAPHPFLDEFTGFDSKPIVWTLTENKT